MAWLLAVTTLFLQAPGADGEVDPWLVLPPSVGPELEQIMSAQDLEPRLGAGWKFGDARITPTTITVEILHQEQPAAVIKLERPQVGHPLPTGGWFAYRVEILKDSTPQLEAALREVAGALDRGFRYSPWKPPVRPGAKQEPVSKEVPAGSAVRHQSHGRFTIPGIPGYP